MEKNFFDSVQHNNEIINSRVGGLGGSDASMVAKVGRNGLSSLSNTDLKRLAVMLGQIEYVPFTGNDATKAGHMFEDWLSVLTPQYKREERLEAELTTKFKTFAHADFYLDGEVLEAKYVQASTEEVKVKYYAQLQWYYLLGARSVTLFHGDGDINPFNVNQLNRMPIERDEAFIEILKCGIRLLSEFVEDFHYLEASAEVEAMEGDITTTIANLVEAKAKIDHYTKLYNDFKADIEKFMEDNGLNAINGDNYTISKGKAVTSYSFDAKAFLKAHPEYDKDTYYKATNKKGAFSIKFKDDESK